MLDEYEQVRRQEREDGDVGEELDQLRRNQPEKPGHGGDRKEKAEPIDQRVENRPFPVPLDQARGRGRVEIPNSFKV